MTGTRRPGDLNMCVVAIKLYTKTHRKIYQERLDAMHAKWRDMQNEMTKIKAHSHTNDNKKK